jgi:hypothetical protein
LRDGLNDAAGDEIGQNAPDRGVGGRKAFGARERAELGAAPDRKILPQALDCSPERGRPVLLSNP